MKTPPPSTLAGSQIEVDNYGGAITLNGTLDINNALFTGDRLKKTIKCRLRHFMIPNS